MPNKKQDFASLQSRLDQIRQKEYLSIHECALFFSISRNTVRKHIRNGSLDAFTINGRFKIRRSTAMSYFRRHGN